jgi:acetoacetyl-CoA synthetase
MLGFALDTSSPEPNEAGELICRQAFPIQPLGFWPLSARGGVFDDAEVQKAQERFKESYFKDDQGLWYHGDL